MLNCANTMTGGGDSMDERYVRLREFLDGFPLGFPATDSGVELEILVRLFTPEEAAAAVLLTPFPEEAGQVAARAGLDPAVLEALLESMAGKGLVFRVRRGGRTLYSAIPFMIGLYEYSVVKVDQELAALFKEYYESAYMDEMGASGVPGFKVLPIGDHIEAEIALFPYAMLKQAVVEARKISVTDCICRKEARLTGGGCDRPMETCLGFGAAAEFYIENGIGREITAEEALDIIERADRAGLVHAGTNTVHLSNLCNCCPCCCASMKGITTRGHDRRLYLNALFEAVVDQEECTGCGDCEDRCPVGALTLAAAASVSRDECLGCGLCAGACERGAITLRLREDREEPFGRMLDLGAAILDGKRRREEEDRSGNP
jgi:NAD-dependent dihydropyrimidine dehydrogenase PreA subunit